MSIRATVWALYDVAAIAPGLDPGARLVLLVLADRADETGRNAYPGVRTICDATGLSRATVYRRLADLADAGLIAPGDDRHVAHYRPDRRPKVWDLALAGPVDNSSPTGSHSETPTPNGVSHGVSHTTQRGLTVETRTVQNRGNDARAPARARPVVDNSGPTPAPAEFGALCGHGWASAASCPHCPGGRLAHLDSPETARR